MFLINLFALISLMFAESCEFDSSFRESGSGEVSF